MDLNYLESVYQQFRYYRSLGEKTFDQLTEEQLLWKPNEASNSIAIIVNHLNGNMLSRWTDFLTSDGEKEWRMRDQEFEEVIQSRKELIEKWNTGWDCLFRALDNINEDNMDTIVYIRNQGHTIVEAVNRQLCHYSYHIGQITYIGRLIIDSEWKSLSIPKNASKAYNKEKFDKPKRREHFTKEILDGKSEKLKG